MKIETSFSLRKNWLLAGYELSYRGSASLTGGVISEIASAFLKDILPLLVTKTTSIQLHNFKGRTPSDQLITALPPAADHELFCLNGEIASSGEDEEILWEPFSVSAHTKFKEFIGLEGAEYLLEIIRSTSTPSEIPIHLLADAITVKLQSFRFGFEHFQPTTQKYFFGYTPAIQEVFLLDITAEELKFEIRVDGSSRKVEDPLSVVPQLAAALEIIGAIFGRDLPEEFRQSIKSYL